MSAAAADNFSWLGGAPSIFRLAAAPNDSGWRRRRESAAEGSTCQKLMNSELSLLHNTYEVKK